MEQTISDDVRLDLKEKYIVVKKLLSDESKNDPESEPYKSKYAAVKILQSMKNILLNNVDNTLDAANNEVAKMIAIVDLNLGIVSLDTEELKAGEEYLLSCLEMTNKTSPIRPILLISALNQLAILWSRRDQAAKAQVYLERAEKVYKDSTAPENNAIVESMSAEFGILDDDEPEPQEVLKKLHTLTLYYLAQIYGTLEDYLKSAIYCHMTLLRQLEYVDTVDFDSIDWALNTATLSQFFMEKGSFQQARHHLAAATHILQKYKETLKLSNIKEEESEIEAAKWENFNHRSADIARCWAKYGILLLCTSRERLIKSSEESTSSDSDPSPDSDTSLELIKNLKFEAIENDIKHIAEDITDKYLLDFDDARLVFIKTKKWLADAKSYYTLEDHASDYVQVVQDESQAYKYLIFFEESEDRQAKMHKRRIDMLEEICKELNEQYYLGVCQQIWIELGETYSEILDIKLDCLKATEDRPTPHMLNKINNLTKKSIYYFNKFLNSIKEPGSDKFNEEMIRPVLSTYFHLGRLYYKFITPDKKVQLENATHSFDAYTKLINYCERDANAREIMTVELSICKDFVKLLSMKIDKLKQEIADN